MQLTKKQIIQFQKLYKESYNIELSVEESLSKALKLLRLMEIVYRPITVDQILSIAKRREYLLKKRKDSFTDFGD